MYSGIPNLNAFKEALLAPIRDVKIRVTALNSSLVPIEEVTASTIEGTVYVDTSRATRRTCQLRLIDKKEWFQIEEFLEQDHKVHLLMLGKFEHDLPSQEDELLQEYEEFPNHRHQQCIQASQRIL